MDSILLECFSGILLALASLQPIYQSDTTQTGQWMKLWSEFIPFIDVLYFQLLVCDDTFIPYIMAHLRFERNLRVVLFPNSLPHIAWSTSMCVICGYVALMEHFFKDYTIDPWMQKYKKRKYYGPQYHVISTEYQPFSEEENFNYWRSYVSQCGAFHLWWIALVYV